MLNKQGDGPHLGKNPLSPVNFTNYPSCLRIGSHQAAITAALKKVMIAMHKCNNPRKIVRLD